MAEGRRTAVRGEEKSGKEQALNTHTVPVQLLATTASGKAAI